MSARCLVESERIRPPDDFLISNAIAIDCAAGVSETIDDILIKKEEIMNLSNSLKVLTETQYRRVRMRFIYNMSYTKIAGIEGYSRHSVQRSVEGALRKLRTYLEEK